MYYKDSYFTFNDKLYHQKEVIAMGNPLGLIFTDIRLGYYKNEWIINCPMFAFFREITHNKDFFQ